MRGTREQGDGDRASFDAAPQPVGPSRFAFPSPAAWPAGDLIAVGGDLEPSTIVAAYRQGVFPMVLDAEEPEPMLGWWSPDPRGILPLDLLRVSASLRRSARRFDVRVDTAFAQVVRACADPSRESGWITEEFIAAYVRLHDLGWAHSVEAFDADGRLAGGLYGLRVGRLFAGESMFHRQRDASKTALMGLVRLMRLSGMTLLDVQWCTDHLRSLGAIEVSRARYLEMAAAAVG
ncbi:MAG: leucyl/phenylalanyl-tRNA--protein transferase [Acidobacteria bacterium]|nr:leucyl/phenylalanyl-tRNA--protein transferase [Acidobacteriota bacterium]